VTVGFTTVAPIATTAEASRACAAEAADAPESTPRAYEDSVRGDCANPRDPIALAAEAPK